MTSALAALKRPVEAEIKTAFEGDKLSRKNVATYFSTILDRFGSNSGVILVDAKWGEGKSWFARNWHKLLLEEEKSAIYLDAFSKDYIDDPFLILVGEILKNDLIVKDRKEFIERAAEVKKAALPTVTKIIANVCGLLLTGIPGTGDLTDRIIEKVSDSIGDAAETNLENLIEDYEKQTDSIRKFKALLEESVKDKKLYIFVDELDRCKPDFAIKFIERIKHFFEIPNIVFVLFTNKTELEKAIRGIYGPIDATSYLSKFIDITLNLPVHSKGSKRNQKYIEHIATALNLSIGPTEMKDLVEWTTLFDFSLRDIDRLFTLLLVEPTIGATFGLKVFLAVIKLKHPELFDQMRNENLDVFIKLRSVVEENRAIRSFDPDLAAGFHSFASIVENDFKNISQKASDAVNTFIPFDALRPHYKRLLHIYDFLE